MITANTTAKKRYVQKRSQAFLEVVKNKYKYLLLLGALFMLAAAPIITFRYLTIVHQIEVNAAVQAGEFSANDGLLEVNALQNFYYAVSIALVLLPCLVLAGAAKVVKCFSWREPTPFKDNFGEGIKENVINYSICFIINVLLLWMNNFVRNCNVEFSVWYYLPTAVWYLVVLPVSMWFCASTAVYKDKFFKTLSVSAKLFGLTLFYTYAAEILLVWPLALLLIPVAWVQLAVPFIYTLLYLPLSLLALIYMADSAFDKYINAVSFPDLVNKGLKNE
jgi:hypothetical protein